MVLGLSLVVPSSIFAIQTSLSAVIRRDPIKCTSKNIFARQLSPSISNSTTSATKIESTSDSTCWLPFGPLLSLANDVKSHFHKPYFLPLSRGRHFKHNFSWVTFFILGAFLVLFDGATASPQHSYHSKSELFVDAIRWNFSSSSSSLENASSPKSPGANHISGACDGNVHLSWIPSSDLDRLSVVEERPTCTGLNKNPMFERDQRRFTPRKGITFRNDIDDKFASFMEWSLPLSLHSPSHVNTTEKSLVECQEYEYVASNAQITMHFLRTTDRDNKNESVTFRPNLWRRNVAKRGSDNRNFNQKYFENKQSKKQFKSYHEYCVIGAGPAGLQMAYFLKQASRNYIVYERGNISGSFFEKYPRHRKLISINKRFTGSANAEFQLRHDWNSLLSDRNSLLFKRFSTEFFPHAESLVTYLNEYQKQLDINVQYNTDIRNVRKIPKDMDRPPMFMMNDQSNNTFSCRYLIVATGLWKPYTPHFEGSHHVHGYEEFDLNVHKYEGKNVLILGRGNSAFETAESLYGHTNFVHMVSRSRARLAWNTHYVGDLRAINNGLLDTYQLKSLDGLLEAAVEEMTLNRIGGKLYVNFPGDARIRQDFKGFGGTPPNRTIVRTKETSSKMDSQFTESTMNSATRGGEDKPMDNFSLREGYDFVIRCLGFTFDYSLFKNSDFFSKLGMEGKYPGIKDTYESRIMPDLYVAGTLAHSLDYRKSSGGFIHGFRYTVRVLHRLLEWKNHRVPWPMASHKTLDLLNVIVRRVNEASGPYQMFQTLADVIVLRKDRTTFYLLEEFPIALLPRLETLTGRSVDKGSHILVLLMEYGPDFSGPDKDTFRSDRATGDPMEAHRSNFLHPVLYYYDTLPTESDMLVKWGKLPMPKPQRLHHVLEDFLTSWMAQQTHILPLRRFLETVFFLDMRHRFASSCFHLSLIYSSLPVRCHPSTTSRGHLVFRPMVQVS